MPTTLTRESLRVHIAMRLAAQLRRSRERVNRRSMHSASVMRMRIGRDGMVVGRSILFVPFDLS